MKPRFIVMDAPGCYQKFAIIHSSHASLVEALKAKGNNKRLMVSTDGGFHTAHQRGMKIHRDFASQYERLDS